MTSTLKTPESEGGKSNPKPADKVDPDKPVVKEFVDIDNQIFRFLETRLPHVPYSTLKIVCVYISHDKTEMSFRANWFTHKHEGIAITNHLVKSCYVKLVVKDKDYEIIKVD